DARCRAGGCWLPALHARDDGGSLGHAPGWPIAGDGRMKLSARNQLKGTIKRITPGAVNHEVVIELPGGIEIVSIITAASAEALGLRGARKPTLSSRRRT